MVGQCAAHRYFADVVNRTRKFQAGRRNNESRVWIDCYPPWRSPVLGRNLEAKMVFFSLACQRFDVLPTNPTDFLNFHLEKYEKSTQLTKLQRANEWKRTERSFCCQTSLFVIHISVDFSHNSFSADAARQFHTWPACLSSFYSVCKYNFVCDVPQVKYHISCVLFATCIYEYVLTINCKYHKKAASTRP